MKKEKSNTKEPSIAPGIDDWQELDQDASSEEVREGDYTKVTRLVYDEVDPS